MLEYIAVSETDAKEGNISSGIAAYEGGASGGTDSRHHNRSRSGRAVRTDAQPHGGIAAAFSGCGGGFCGGEFRTMYREEKLIKIHRFDLLRRFREKEELQTEFFEKRT